jgi:CyaY protein
MNEQDFARLADAELAALEAALETAGGDYDIELKPGGILELECTDGSKIIINRHSAAREIWVAARSGGFHFASRDGQWLSARDGGELWQTLERCLSEQTGEAFELTRTR